MEKFPVLLGQGAEAVVTKEEFNGKIVVKKMRFAKTYRIEVLDKKLRKNRTNQVYM
jgi:tRNA A-37 threonylcarbamoyl transferase component Bud32